MLRVKMQSPRRQTRVQQLLKCQLQDLIKEHTKWLRSVEKLNKHVATVEEKMNNLEEKPEVGTQLQIAAYMDLIEEKMGICYQAIASIEALPTIEQVTLCRQELTEQTPLVGTAANSNTIAASIIQAQMEGIQNKVERLQELHDNKVESRLQQLEDKVLILEEPPQSVKELYLRLQKLEAKFLLVENLQPTNDKSIEYARFKASVEEDIERLEIWQDVLKDRIQNVQSNTDNLIRLRDNLNQLHNNVTKRDELSAQVSQLQEQMTKLQCKVIFFEESLDTFQDKNGPGTIMPAFVASAEGSPLIYPANKIPFHNVKYNEYGCFDAEERIFIAPSEGLYLFSVSLNTNSQAVINAAIMKNGAPTAYCATTGLNTEQTSTSVLLSLSTLDQVWVEAVHDTSETGVRIAGNFSNFIGCYLHR